MNPRSVKLPKELTDWAETIIPTVEFNKSLMDLHNDLKKDLSQFEQLMMRVTAYLRDANGKISIVPAMFADTPETTNDKAFMMKGLGVKVHEEMNKIDIDHRPQLMYVILQSEAWVSMKKTEKEVTENFVQPSKYPDRQEAIVSTGVTLDGRTNMAMTVFKRNKPKGDVTIVQEQSMMYSSDSDYSAVESPLISAFMQGYGLSFTHDYDERHKDKNTKSN